MRRALEQAWLAHVIAVGSGKESELEKTTSSYYFATMRNNVARSGRTLTPENIVALGTFFPDLNTTNFVTVIENGPTAALVHARESKQTDSTNQPRVDYLFLRFVDEGRGWKVDAYAIVNAPKYQTDGSLAPFRLPANSDPVYRIDGQIRPAPAPIPVAR